MLKDYDTKSKSKHWERFYTAAMAAAITKESNLEFFRSPQCRLNQDILGQASWYRTANAYRTYLTNNGDFNFEISETSIGRPKTYRLGGRDVSYHDVELADYAYTIQSNLTVVPDCIVEIGGGFGGLAYKLKKTYPSSTYILLDLPEALTIQAWYLLKNFPNAKFYLYNDYMAGRSIKETKYDFILLPGWLSNVVPDVQVDLVINTRSMMEMTSDVIADYFVEIQRFLRVGGHFYNVNRYCKDSVGEPIRLSDYPYGSNCKPVLSRQSRFQSHIHELLTKRIQTSSSEMEKLLSELPKVHPGIEKPVYRTLRGRLELIHWSIVLKKENGRVRRAPLIEAFDVAKE